MGTYASNSEIKLDTGRDIDSMMDEDLSTTEKTNAIRSARERAFNHINARIDGQTAIPAFHIPVLKQVEIDLVISDVIAGAFTLQTANVSEWSEKYKERADQVLETLTFGAAAEEPIAHRSNTGDGRLKIIEVNDDMAKTEQFLFMALTADEFSIVGSVSGRLPNITVGDDYPSTDWTAGSVSDYGLVSTSLGYDEFPFYCKITAGSTDFVKGDNFKVRIFGSSQAKSTISIGRVVRA
jgi:hypothetical protein